MKVEIGSDAQSTVGTEPSYQHTEGLISYDRGIQFWFMQEAKKRNPNIVIAALEWSAPSWVGSPDPEYGCPGWAGCAFFTDKNIDYIIGWMKGAIDVWHIDRIDYLGVRSHVRSHNASNISPMSKKGHQLYVCPDRFGTSLPFSIFHLRG